MTPRAMAAFQQHQETIESRFGNNKTYQNDIALSRQESSSSIPCSSDMISVKNIEDREDEYSKMKLALLSDITEASNNGSSSPLAAITSPSLAHGILPLRGQEEGHSSVYRDKPKLGPRTRSKDNLESIFGGTMVQQAEKPNNYVSNTSVVHKSLLQDDRHTSLPNNSNTMMERIHQSSQDTGMSSVIHSSRSKMIDPLVKTATSISSSNIPSTCNPSHSNRSQNNKYDTKDGRDNQDTAINNSQNKSKNKFTKDVKRPISPSQAYHHIVEGSNSYEYSAVPSIATTREGLKHLDKEKRIQHRHHKPPGFIKEESFPLDISPASNTSSADFRTPKVRNKSESGISLGVVDKKGAASAVPNISSSATGDVYTIPEVPEEEDASSPFQADGVSKRRMAGRFNQHKCSSVYTSHQL